MKEIHRRLQYVVKHRIVKIFTSVRADFDEEHIPYKYCYNAHNDTKCIYVYCVNSSYESMLIQSEYIR